MFQFSEQLESMVSTCDYNPIDFIWLLRAENFVSDISSNKQTEAHEFYCMKGKKYHRHQTVRGNEL